jgi:putative phosphoesterase
MKCMVISDLHGAKASLEQALSAFKAEGADSLFILGDYINHGPRNPIPADYEPSKLGPCLNAHKEKIVAVRGNCDSEVDQMILEFPMLSDYAVAFLGGRRLFLTHGHLFNPDKLPPLSPGDVFLSGHTHVPVLERRGDIYVVNPGSIGIPKGGSQKGYAMVDETGIWLKTIEGEVISQLVFDPSA